MGILINAFNLHKYAKKFDNDNS